MLRGWIYGWLLGSLVLSSGAQLLLKQAMRTPLTFRSITNPWLLGGMLAYAASAGFWLLVLRRLPLTQAYPWVSLNFVFVLVGSVIGLHERVSWPIILGTSCILVGLVVISVAGT
jgi:undecaprenyl phosphate-alpha-L-ara4N flippase subunit ArnE